MQISVFKSALVLAMVASLGVGPGCASSSAPVAGDAAVVMCATSDRSELCVVDLNRFELVRRVRLRSLALSIAGEPSSGRVVTAQCGGVGGDTDDAAGVFGFDDRRPTYVSLEAPNPGDVAATDGYALLTHGFMDEEGLYASVVDVRSGSLLETGRVPDGSLRPVAHADTVLIPCSTISATATPSAILPGTIQLLELDRSLRPSTLATVPLSAAVVVEGETGPLATLIGRSADGQALAVRVELQTGRPVASSVIEGMPKGPASACQVGDRIAVVGADAVNPEDPGRDVVLLDRESLQVADRITVSGTPAAVAGWKDRLLVYDCIEGKLLLYAPDATTPEKSITIQQRPSIGGDIAVVLSSSPPR